MNKLPNEFRFNQDEIVLYKYKHHRIISRLRFDHSNELNANYLPGQKYYLLSMVGAPVKEEEVQMYDIYEGC